MILLLRPYYEGATGYEAVNIEQMTHASKLESGHTQIWFPGDDGMSAQHYDIMFEDFIGYVSQGQTVLHLYPQDDA